MGRALAGRRWVRDASRRITSGHASRCDEMLAPPNTPSISASTAATTSSRSSLFMLSSLAFRRASSRSAISLPSVALGCISSVTRWVEASMARSASTKIGSPASRRAFMSASGCA